MNKKILVESEIKVLNLISMLQDKINKNTDDDSFDVIMEKYFKNAIKDMTYDEFTRLRITLFNLEELNLIAGDVLSSPRVTKEGKEILAYYREREIITQRCVGLFVITIFGIGALKIINKIFR